MRKAESNPRSLKGDSGPIQRDSRFCPIFASEPRCFNFGIRPDSQFSRILAFSDRIPLRLPENTDIREWWSSWNQAEDVMGQERLPVSEPPAGPITERTRAETLNRFALRVGVS